MIAAFGVLIISAINPWPIYAAAQTMRSSIVEEVYEAYTHPTLRGQALIIAGTCMLGKPDESIRLYREATSTTAVITPVQYCVSIYAAADAQKVFVSEIERADGDIYLKNPAYAFAVGFGLGIASPEKYAAYTSASDAMIDQVSDDCVLGKGGREECSIAGALQAIRAAEDMERLAALYPVAQ
jgi:hypothetical protein